MEIIQAASKDERFDIIVKDTQRKLRVLITEKADAVKEYSKQWVIPETEEGVQDALHELYDTIVIAYGATGIRPDKERIVLDFFLYLFFYFMKILLIVECIA